MNLLIIFENKAIQSCLHSCKGFFLKTSGYHTHYGLVSQIGQIFELYKISYIV